MIRSLKAVVADVDGTLVDKGQPMHEATRNAIIRLHEEGVLFGLATGRKINKSIFARNRDWGLPFEFDIMIGMNGGQVWDSRHEGFENYYMLKREVMREIIDRMSPLHCNAMMYEDEKMVALYWDEQIHSSMMRNNMEVLITEGDADRICIRDNYNVIFRFDPERTAEVAAYAKTLDCDRYRSVQTSDGIIEFMDPRVNKGLGLRKYAERNNADIGEIMAFGDMDNDAELVKAAGWGVCLLNGSEVTKAAADAVTEYTCAEGGVGRYLEDHWFSRRK